MKTIIFTVLSATLLLASSVTTTENTPQETTTKSRDAVLAEKQATRTSKLEAEITKKELARVAKAKIRDEKIQQMDTELKEKAVQRANA